MLAQHFPSVYATVGIHPEDCNHYGAADVKNLRVQLEKMLNDKEPNKIVAIGEIGLDFFHKPYNKERQGDFFKMQIELALSYNLPIVLHIREAADEVLSILETYSGDRLRGVAHCFLQDANFAQKIIDWGFYVGLDAPITYPKNEWLRTLFASLPLERIVLETDAPFLPPQQYRGQQNKPTYIPLIAQALAQIKNIDRSVIEQTTTDNARSLFFGSEAR
jgi:TatD DNase family protein